MVWNALGQDTDLCTTTHFWLTTATDVNTTTHVWLLRRACPAGMAWGNTLTDLYIITHFLYGMGWGNTFTDLYIITHFLYGMGWGNTFTDLYTTTHVWLTTATDVYWAIQRIWFARVNALCNLSRKKSGERSQRTSGSISE